MLAVGLYRCLRLGKSLVFLVLLSVFTQQYWILCCAFSASIEAVLCFFPIDIMYCITWLFFFYVKPTFHPGISPTWLRCTILFLWCWTSFFHPFKYQKASVLNYLHSVFLLITKTFSENFECKEGKHFVFCWSIRRRITVDLQPLRELQCRNPKYRVYSWLVHDVPGVFHDMKV